MNEEIFDELEEACIFRDRVGIKDFIDKIESKDCFHVALGIICQYEEVDILLGYLKSPRFDPGHWGYALFAMSCKHGLLPIIDYLLTYTKTDPTSHNNKVLVCAHMFKHPVATINRLLDDGRIDPGDWNNTLLRSAVAARNLSLVNRLLGYQTVDPRMGILHMFGLTEEFMHFDDTEVDILTRLLQDPRVDKEQLLDYPPIYDMLSTSCLRMACLYSKSFFGVSRLPRHLIHNINSFVEPFHLKETERIGLFIESLQNGE